MVGAARLGANFFSHFALLANDCLATGRPPSGIIGAIPPGVEPSLLRWHRKLEENGVVCAPREGMLRFSPHFYNDDAEVDRVIELLR